MFNPIKVVLPPKQEETLVEETTLEKAYNSFSTDLFSKLRDSHAKMIETQKSLFKKLKNEISDADEYAYRIITTKYEIYSETIFNFLYDKVVNALKLLYKNCLATDQQVRILRAAMKHDNALAYRMYTTNGDIGIRTIGLPSQKEFATSFNGFGHSWSNMEPMDRVEEFKKLPEWFKNEGSIWERMDAHREIRFKKDQDYSLDDIISYYNQFKEGVKTTLNYNRKQIADLKVFVKKTYEKNAADFKSYIEQINSLNLSKDEKDTMISIANHNCSLLLDIFTTLSNGLCNYQHRLGYYIYTSIIAYKELIQFIYDQVYAEKEDTNHGFLNNFKFLKEDKLSTKDRREIAESDFGIPSQRKYPMPDKSHLMQAIRFFNKVDAEHEEELARNIIKKMKAYGVSPDVVGPTNRLRKYL